MRKAFWLRSAAIFGVALVASAATFKPATLLLDINTVPIPVSSHPSVLCDAPGFTLLLSQVQNLNYKVWRTDGTTTGTTALHEWKTTQSTSSFSCLYEGASVVYFQASNDAGLATLWRSDGTSAGTFQLIGEQEGIYQYRLLGVQGVPLFVAQLSASTGEEIVRTDGTVAGTTLLRDFTPGPEGSNFAVSAVNLGGQLYFAVNGSLWATDGTAAGTRVVISNPAGQEYLSEPTVALAGNRVLLAYIDLAADTQLWSSDGTTAGSFLLSTFHTDGSTTYLQNLTTASASRAIFSLPDPNPNQPNAVFWRTDGTVTGTQPLLTSQGEPLYVGGAVNRLGNGIVVMASTPTTTGDPWVTDGTDAGTRLLHHHDPGTYIYPWIPVSGGLAYYSATAAQWWFTDGTPAGTWSFTGLNAQFDADYLFDPISSGASFLMWSQDRVGSPGQTTDFRHTLWRISPASRSISRVVDINPHQLEYVHGLSGGRLLMSLDTGTAGFEPWITDGTPTGLRLLRDLEPETQNGWSDPLIAFNVGANLLFGADDGRQGKGLWTTDGNAAGTQRLSAGAPVVGQYVLPSLDFGGATLYAGLNPQGVAELWKTDGTAAGTSMVRDLSSPAVFGNGRVGSDPGLCGAGFLGGSGVAYYGASPARVGKLFRTDGTSAGTIELGAFPNNGRGFLPTSRVCVLALSSGSIYFEAMDPQTSELLLWRSNGQVGNYERVVDAGGATLRAPQNMMEMGGSLWFFTLAQNQWSLWKLTPGDPVARRVLPRSWTTDSSFPLLTAVLGNTLLFRDAEVAANGAYTFKMYRTDGTAAGTYSLGTTGGNSPLRPESGIRYGTKYLFPGVGDATGMDVFVTDGTTTGTTVLRVAAVGDQTSPNPEFVNFNGLVYFAINRFVSGLNSTEIWRTDGTAAGTERVNPVPLFYRYLPGVHLAVSGHKLIFSAGTEANGTELWTLENEAPVAQGDSASTTSPNAVTIEVLANDSDPDGVIARASLRVTGNPASGTATADGITGTIRYTPNAGFSGTDTFRYTVADTQGRESTATTVTVTVAAAPGGGGGSGGGGSGGGSGGGGGALDWWALGALLILGARRATTRPH